MSTASLFIRYAQADGAPSLVIAAWRLSLATLVLAPVVIWRHRQEFGRITAREWSLVAASGVFLGLHFGTWISSLAFTSVANSVVFVSTAPLFVAIIAAGLLRERLTGWVLAGLAVALAGSVVVGVSDACSGPPAAGCPAPADFVRGEGFLGDMLALAGAAAVAIYLVIGRSVRARLPLLVYIFLTYGVAALTLLAGVWLMGAGDARFAPAAFPASVAAGLAGLLAEGRPPVGGWALWVLLLALIPQLIGHSAYNWALKYLPATFVSVTVLGEPIGSILLALALLNETPSPLKLLGAGLILAGILSAARRPPDKS